MSAKLGLGSKVFFAWQAGLGSVLNCFVRTQLDGQTSEIRDTWIGGIEARAVDWRIPGCICGSSDRRIRGTPLFRVTLARYPMKLPSTHLALCCRFRKSKSATATAAARTPYVGRNSLFGSTPRKSLEPHHQAKITTEKKNSGVCVLRFDPASYIFSKRDDSSI